MHTFALNYAWWNLDFVDLFPRWEVMEFYASVLLLWIMNSLHMQHKGGSSDWQKVNFCFLMCDIGVYKMFWAFYLPLISSIFPPPKIHINLLRTLTVFKWIFQFFGSLQEVSYCLRKHDFIWGIIRMFCSMTFWVIILITWIDPLCILLLKPRHTLWNIFFLPKLPLYLILL